MHNILIYISIGIFGGAIMGGKIIVNGGNKLTGEISISGAKNAILPILAATVIGGNESTIFNVPNLRDVKVMENNYCLLDVI